MRRSLRSSVVTWLTSKAPCSRKPSEFVVRPSAAVKPTAFLSSAVRLSMPFARLSDSVTRKTLKLFRKPRRSSLRYLRFLLLALVLANQKSFLQKLAKATKIGLRIQNAFAIFVSFCLRLFLYQRRCCISDRQAYNQSRSNSTFTCSHGTRCLPALRSIALRSSIRSPCLRLALEVGAFRLRANPTLVSSD